MTRRAWLLFSTLCLVWGVPYLLIRVAVTDLDPVVVAFGRTLLGGLILLPVALRQKALRPVLKRWPVLLLYTVVEISGPWFFLGHAEQTLTSSTAGLLVAMVPLISFVLVWASGGERVSTLRVVGLGIGIAGVATLVGLDVDFSDLTSVGAILLTAIGYAVGPIIINRRLSDIPATGVITASLLLAALLYVPVLPFVWPATVPADAGWAVVALAVVCTATAFQLFFALIKEAGPARATVITFINPAVAILLGVLVLDEPFTVGIAIGFPLVILGAALATSRNRAVAEPVATPAAAGPAPGSPRPR
ncbi:DMT family transporter [Nakamurella deserti]|uniref:DMT family transporter n=1 Tax=Nakamurella deserti TaxID=2164074 RepID=UPI000DBE266E|nr:DMT family transporter [Nakamurella deserti]